MATGVGFGFDLSFLKELEKADRRLDLLMQKSNKMSSAVTKDFMTMARNGVVPFVESLKQQKKILEEIGNVKHDGTNKMFSNLQRSAKNTVDEINKVLQALQKTKGYRSEASGRSAISFANKTLSARGDKSIDNLRKALAQLEAAQNRQNLNTKTGQKNYEKLAQSITHVKNEIDKVTGSTENLKKSHSKLLDTSGQLARAMAAVFSVSAIKGYVNKLMQIRGEFELQQRSLQVLLQNKDEANALWDKTVALAVKSPYTTKQLVTATKQLAAYRVESEKLYETNKMLADVSIGLGVDMNRLILAFGQVKAANFLRGTELRQFSEAGVNMLDELAKRFTMLEGRAVSVGEVFERVSKRMVSFADVEAVFKTITSEGGTFYQMQEKQSETLKGMMLNLKDSYELMLNDIGKSNEGLLKGFVSMMKSIVDNWQEIAFVVEKIGYALLTYTAVTKLAQLGTTKMAQTFLKFTGITAQSVKSLNLFQKVLTGIGMLGAGAVLAGLIYGFLEIWRVSTKASREAERLQKELQEIYRTDYSEFKQQTKTFNDLVDKLKDVNQGSEEHREIIQKLNSQYGEYIGFVVTEATTYDKLKSSIEGVNQALLRKSKMSTYEKAYTKIFDETNKTIDKGIEKLKSDIRRVTVTKGGSVVLPTEDEINDIVKILEERLKKLGNQTPLWSDVQEAFKEYGLELEQIRGWSNLSLYDWKKALITQKEAELKLEQQINAQYSDTTAKTIEHRKALKQIDEMEKSRLEKAKKQGDTSSISYQKEVDRIKKEAQISRIQAQVQYEGLDKDVANKRIAELNKFSDTVIDINNKIEASADKLGEKYASIIYIDEAEAETGISQIAESTAQSYKTMQDVIKQQNALKEAGTVHDQNILENAEKTAAAYYYKLQLLGRLDLLQEKTTNGSNKELQLLNKQLSALKESKQTFDQLRQKFGLEEATKKTAKAFEDLFKELDMTAFTIDMTFDNQGIIDVINELPNKAGEAGRQAMEKLKAEMAGGIDVGVKVREDEDLLRQIENMFSGYELSIELQKLNIPPDLAKRLFNVDSISLPELKNQLVGMESLFAGTEMEKQYREFLQKVTEMEKKAQVEMLKNYSKYLVQAQSERIKIKLDEIKQLREIESLNIGEEDKELMRQGVKKNIQERLDSQAWKDFQDTGMYVRLFDNLETASMKSLDAMEDRLIQMRENLKELSPTELKEINNQLDKIREIKLDKNPFKDLKEDTKDYFEYLRNRKDWQKDLESSEAKEKALKEQVETEQLAIDADEKSLAITEKIYGENSLITRVLTENLEQRKANLKVLLDELEAQGKITKEQREQIENGENAVNSNSKRIEKFSQAMLDIGSFIDDIASKWESAFGMSDQGKMGADLASGILGGVGQAGMGIAKAIANPADPSSWMAIASGIMSVVASIGEYNDAKLQNKIDAEAKSVERLRKMYEDLEEQIKNTYDISELNSTTKAAQDNLLAQISATERMIDAEEDKKKSDQDAIDGYKDEIDNLKKQYKELEETRLQELGAFATDENKKSGAEAFLDAWMEAYKQTGDGLSGLNDKFDEFFEDSVKRQMLQKATSKYLDNLFNKYDSAISDWAEGDLTEKELNEKLSGLKNDLPALNENLKKWAEATGIAAEFAGKDADLSGLAAGVQGITEDQADILAAYWSNVSLYTQDTNQKVNDLVTKLFSSDTDVNPMLSKIQELVMQTTAIKNHIEDFMRNGTSYVKVKLIE